MPPQTATTLTEEERTTGLLMTLDLAQESPQLQFDSYDIRNEGIPGLMHSQER